MQLVGNFGCRGIIAFLGKNLVLLKRLLSPLFGPCQSGEFDEVLLEDLNRSWVVVFHGGWHAKVVHRLS